MHNWNILLAALELIAEAVRLVDAAPAAPRTTAKWHTVRDLLQIAAGLVYKAPAGLVIELQVGGERALRAVVGFNGPA